MHQIDSRLPKSTPYTMPKNDLTRVHPSHYFMHVHQKNRRVTGTTPNYDSVNEQNYVPGKAVNMNQEVSKFLDWSISNCRTYNLELEKRSKHDTILNLKIKLYLRELY